MKIEINIPGIDANEPLNELSVSVSYNEGGRNWFNGNQERRGYYVYVSPERVSGNIRSFVVGARSGGFKFLVTEEKRRNAKKQAKLSAALDGLNPDVVKEYFLNNQQDALVAYVRSAVH